MPPALVQSASIRENVAAAGGGMHSTDSSVFFGNSNISHCRANKGGGLLLAGSNSWKQDK